MRSQELAEADQLVSSLVLSPVPTKLNFLKLFASLDERVLEATDLSSNFGIGDVALLDCVVRLVENEDFSFAHASGHRDAPDNSLSCV